MGWRAVENQTQHDIGGKLTTRFQVGGNKILFNTVVSDDRNHHYTLQGYHRFTSRPDSFTVTLPKDFYARHQ